MLPIEETSPAETHFVKIGCVSSFFEYQPKNEDRGLTEEEETAERPVSENRRTEQNLIHLLLSFESAKDSCRR